MLFVDAALIAAVLVCGWVTWRNWRRPPTSDDRQRLKRHIRRNYPDDDDTSSTSTN